jgi:hypothetical protein
MKKITLFLLLVLVSSWQVNAQQASSYDFSSSTGAYTENSSASTAVAGVRADDFISTVQNIGFNFVYEGVTRTQFKMSSNGFISFNLTGTENLATNDLSATNAASRPIIAPLWDDLDGSPATSSANFEVTGVAPNRVLTIEWRNWEWNWQSTTPVISFQVKLYETTNVIQFVYRQEATDVNAGFTGGASIGIGASIGSGAGSFLNLSSVATIAVSSSVPTNDILTKPETGQIYTFIPPPPATVAPTCIPVLTVVPFEGCGNFATIFTWPAVPSAAGYRVSIGTLQNGQGLVVNNVDIGPALTYSFVGSLSTTYYYTVTPYNDAGSPTCTEASFVTFDDGCYCVGLPTSLDGNGISSITIGESVFPTPPQPVQPPFPAPAIPKITYFNLTNNGAADITQGINNLMNITLATGFTYNTNIWIDFNDNFNFEPSELVFFGESLAPNPTTQNTSFILPITVPVGLHRLRIVSTDDLQTPSNPCYIGDWGQVIDLKVNVLLAPACVPPTASTVSNITPTTATLNWVSTATLFNLEFGAAGFTQGNGVVTAGITGLTTNITGLASQSLYNYYLQTNCGSNGLSTWAGPFTFRTLCASFNIPFVQDFSTFLPLCWKTANAGTLASGPSATVSTFWAADGFLNVGTTGATRVNIFSNSFSNNKVDWMITPDLNTVAGSAYTFSFNYGATVWLGTDLTPMGSDDYIKIAMSIDLGVTWTEIHTFNAASNVTNLSQTFSTATTATTSQVRFAFIASDGTVTDTADYDFFIDNVAFDVTLSNTDFDTNTFTAYPNPVKDVLNVSFEQNISDVTVYNLLGQQVAFKKMNADKGQIDMSNLASGTYLVRVNTENAVKTIKVIKQ